MRSRLLVAAVAAAGLVLGFAVAVGTGVRGLGAIPLLACGLWCAWRLWRSAGPWRTIVVGVVYAASFAVSHPLGDLIGSWPSVLVVSAVTFVVAFALGYAPGRGPGASRSSTAAPPTQVTR